MRPGAVALAVSSLVVLGAGPPAPSPPLPARMTDTGGGTQLITAVAPRAASTTGTVSWWDRKDGRWLRAGSAPARFGANGLVEGASRRQGTNTTPTGLYGLPYAFGIKAAPRGTAYRYRRVHRDSWWCQDTGSRSYNRWTEPRAADCRAAESEHLISYGERYAHALVIGFNYERPVRGRGAGIFLHVNGRGATAGCVSVPKRAMRAILAWADPAKRPHIAVGTASGTTAVTRY
ncbi:L,D-peptidoglycan transpeptidase YkuD (ErfK/YbiS/YcfS/YnhG family) [Streptomyces africanus]|uniref:L,D-peptidoglycan transpeptidase YkuD (ErfK/YbiS/YcfS/YnhG family) n=1 Tax=Streptomyces africanus TaxID=231024 RepID=A0ABU0QIK8_9ACTN|nr:L,D-transpeptidase family protein [Streptomyces africanus]MDQ0747219.1 L,D-peptidoglycan transpeptidase YkuD (ErfK/YbiS/YcfS/YnhG family) [Streptomyces africanus]